MAISGKFETTCTILCMACGQQQNILARTQEWTGSIRKDIICTTPKCHEVLEKHNPKRITKGNVSRRPKLPILSLPNGDQVVLEDYECSESNARLFCTLFDDVLHQIPDEARQALMSHWQTGCGSPHVWLLENRKEWNGGGRAAATPDGLSFYLVSTLLGYVPNEHIKLAIAHELGHMLFGAGGEEYHIAGKERTNTSVQDSFDRPKPDPLLRFRCEWLVWRLMESWGFDQQAADIWMERNVIDDAIGIRPREQPVSDADFKCEYLSQRESIEKKLNDMVFPSDYEKYLKKRPPKTL